ncbi:MAG: hypothetical protein ACOY3D_00195 [Candidatus Omnitrophota bacterium]
MKPFSRNSANPALRFSLALLCFLFVLGCAQEIPATYKEKDIPAVVKKICQEEYNLFVETRVVGNTLWVYAPLSRILHKEYGLNQEKIFDEVMSETLRNIMTSIGRVLISADKSPEFYALVISDIKERGLDYTIIGNVLDIKKSYAGLLPWPEMNQRYVIKLEESPGALADTEGRHLQYHPVTWGEFLAGQVAQRLDARFRQKDLKNLYEIKKVAGEFIRQKLVVNADIIKQPLLLPVASSDRIIEETLKTVNEVMRAYDFRDYTEVEINIPQTGKDVTFSRGAVEVLK